MAKYSDIKGFTVQTVSSDPGAGQFAAGTWAVDAYCPQQTQAGGGFGLATAAVTTGGYDSSAYVQTTVEFNGTSWSAGGSMTRPAGQSFPAFGTEPSGGIAGGYKTSGNAVVNNFESYNGSSFSEETDLNNARQSAGATGASATAGIVVGGTTGVASPPDTTGNNNVEIWNGSSWTEITEINTARYNLKALGSTCPAPTAVVAGGENSGNKNTAVEQYNGSSWTEVEDLNTARSGGEGAGTTTSSGIYYGGEGPASGGYVVYAQTENWNGSSWTEVNDMVSARYNMSLGTGSGSSAIVTAGRNPGYNGLTEIWSAPSTFQTITEGQLFFNSTANAFKETITDVPGGTWASGGAMNQAKGRCGFATNAVSTTTHIGFVYGGNVGPGSPGKTVDAEQYNGTSWTEVSDINTLRASTGGGGTLTSAAYVAGEVPSSPYNSDAFEQWNGASWTTATEINTAIRANTAFGATNTAVITASGYTTTNVATTEQWDGSSWSEVADQNAALSSRGGTGTVTDAILYGGSNPSTNTETWNGAAWTEVSELNSYREFGAASGASSAQVLAVGGYKAPSPSAMANVESWNGASWTEINDISTARWQGGGTGSAVFGLISGGGSSPSQVTTTEEFTAPLANKTIT